MCTTQDCDANVGTNDIGNDYTTSFSFRFLSSLMRATVVPATRNSIHVLADQLRRWEGGKVIQVDLPLTPVMNTM